ncbi:MAG: hypothetical protein JSS72_05010 [Armatimonadetes bacterium]|nr:hypothetical protein [Armatimonadota bacterium]
MTAVLLPVHVFIALKSRRAIHRWFLGSIIALDGVLTAILISVIPYAPIKPLVELIGPMSGSVLPLGGIALVLLSLVTAVVVWEVAP